MPDTLFNVHEFATAQDSHAVRIEAWRDYCDRVRTIATRIRTLRDSMVRDMTRRAFGFALHGGILHNAAIDTACTGWCAGENGRHKNWVARQAKAIEQTRFDGFRVAERAIAKKRKALGL